MYIRRAKWKYGSIARQRRMYALYVTHIGGYTTDLTEI